MITLLFLINALRITHLQEVPALDVIAEERAEYLCNKEISHAGIFDEFKNSPFYGKLGENLAQGYKTDLDAHLALMLSPSHMANMLDTRYTYVGIGKCQDTIVELFAQSIIPVHVYTPNSQAISRR